MNERLNDQGRTLVRIAREMRGWITEAGAQDPEVRSLLRDIDTVEEIGRWLATVVPIEASRGVPAAGSTLKPSPGTAAPARRAAQEDQL